MGGNSDEVVADVVIVGFGGAGACAALEAARLGAEVVVLERFAGGGATVLSGGVVYAGGGTAAQRAAGVADTPEAMEAYLRAEIGDAVSPATLRRFCAGSTEMIGWLEALGVPFEGSLCPYKTSYPSNRHYLYYSGSEAAGGYRDLAPPAPRGHRVKGRGTSGAVLFAVLDRAVRRTGIRVLPQTAATRLLVGGRVGHAGHDRVTGVECRTMAGVPVWVRRAHALASRYAAKPGLYVPAVRRLLHGWARRLEVRYGRPLRVSARRGVVLAAGGFVANRPMLREHAPAYRAGLPLGTPGDDGGGIHMGAEAGGATAKLDRVSAWRFISPPSAFLSGLLVDAGGRRVCDESRYGAALGDAIVSHGGRGWLLVDRPIVAEARRQLRGQTVWFQRLQAEYLLRRAAGGDTVDEVAARAGLDAVGLRDTVAAHNAAVRGGIADPAGKPAEFVRALEQPPYALLDVSIRPSVAYPCPVLTLGGLVVDEGSGQVRRPDGTGVAGLYAAGRTAVGMCSNSYVSGLSLADCVFSGRRAGEHAARAPAATPAPGPEASRRATPRQHREHRQEVGGKRETQDEALRGVDRK